MTTRRSSGEVMPPASEDDSSSHPLILTRNNTLRRCWGALKDTVDALGAGWDAYDYDDEDAEASSSRSPPAPVSPKRPSLDIFKMPRSRPLQESSSSRRSHYDTLTNSPNTSRSSLRKHKRNPQRSTLTPIRRRNEKGDIDHSYSTDEDCPHARVLNRLFYQGPPQALDDTICVFAYPQGKFVENTEPNWHDDKQQVKIETAKSLSPCGSWARNGVVQDEVDRVSLELLRSDRSIRDESHLDREDSKPIHPRTTHEAVENEIGYHNDGTNREDSRHPMAHHVGRGTIPCPLTVPPRILTERAASKLPSARYNVGAWTRQCHVGLQDYIPNTGTLDETHSTGPHSGTKSLKPESQSIEDARVQQQEIMNTWRGQVVPQTPFPREALLDGKRLPEPHFEMRKRRLQRRAASASCIVFSAAIPPERDTSDLLATPFGP